MHTPETSRHFTRWVNPANGVVSHVLTGRVAPVQQTFYFTNPAWSADGRYLWFRCGFPPPGGRHTLQVLGVIDFEHDELHVYPETQFSESSPAVDPLTGDVYWANHLDVWKRGPRPADTAVRVNRFPQNLAAGRLERLATHFTFSADRRALSIDARFLGPGDRQTCHLGAMPLDGSPFQLWQTIEGRFHDHALFSPVDPESLLFAHEYWQDHLHEPFDGLRPYHRLWLLRCGEQARPVLRAPVSHSGHEWWDADGQHIWYVHYGVGVKRVDLATGLETMKWPGHHAHAYSDRTGRHLVADTMIDLGNPDCHVVFRDTVTGNEVEIVNAPPLPLDATTCGHLHPHPHFCLQDRYICHTTTALGRVDVALVPVAELIARTA